MNLSYLVDNLNVDVYFRLSERNCVEIIQRLQEQHLIELIYTTDGKEFLTSQELSKEIREELLVQGGRCSLADQSTVEPDYYGQK